MQVNVETIVSEPFMENSFIVWAEGSTDCVVVDPGFDPEAILVRLGELELFPQAILNTHGHVDHIAGNRSLKKNYPDAPLMIGHGDEAMLTDSMQNLSGQFGFNITSPPADKTVSHGEVVTVGGLSLEVRDVPGHSPGHVVFVIHDAEPTIVLGGDTLFNAGIGRTDFPNGSFSQLKEAIEKQLWPLPDDAIVYTGHGAPTTIGVEKQTNPFVGVHA